MLSASLVTIALVSCGTESTLRPENMGKKRSPATPVLRVTEKAYRRTRDAIRGVLGIARGGETATLRGGRATGITGTGIAWAVDHDGYPHMMFGDPCQTAFMQHKVVL